MSQNDYLAHQSGGGFNCFAVLPLRILTPQKCLVWGPDPCCTGLPTPSLYSVHIRSNDWERAFSEIEIKPTEVGNSWDSNEDLRQWVLFFCGFTEVTRDSTQMIVLTSYSTRSPRSYQHQHQHLNRSVCVFTGTRVTGWLKGQQPKTEPKKNNINTQQSKNSHKTQPEKNQHQHNPHTQPTHKNKQTTTTTKHKP